MYLQPLLPLLDAIFQRWSRIQTFRKVHLLDQLDANLMWAVRFRSGGKYQIFRSARLQIIVVGRVGIRIGVVIIAGAVHRLVQ